MQGIGASFQKVTAKHFYVSPFSSLELNFDFKLRIPGDRLEIHIDDREGESKVLLSTFSGERAALGNGRLFVVQLEISAGHVEGDFFHPLARAEALFEARAVLSQGRQSRAPMRCSESAPNPHRKSQMNQPTTATLLEPLAQRTVGGKPNFYARVILQTLERMTPGCLRLELPDGSQRVIGQH